MTWKTVICVMIQISSVLALMASLATCQKKHDRGIENGGLPQVGKINDLKCYSGYERVWITWKQPVVSENVLPVKYRIFWNNNTDSLEIPAPATDSTSVIVTELAEGNHTFSVYAYDKDGAKSQGSVIRGNVYGSKYQSSLVNWAISRASIEEGSGIVTINWDSPATGTLAAELSYTTSTSSVKTTFISATIGNIKLADVKAGSEITYRTLFVPETNAIDTFYTTFEAIELNTEQEAEGKILWDGDASLGNDIWKVARNIDGSGTISVVDDPTYGKTWNFYKPLGSHRTESHAAKGFQAKEGDDIYIGWRSKITMPSNTVTNSVFQWKAYGTDMQQNYPIIFKTTADGSLCLQHFAPGKLGADVWKVPLQINVWNRFVLRLKVSRDGNIGFIEFWYNGEKQTLLGESERYYSRTLDAEYCDPKWGVYGGDPQAITNFVSGLRIATTLELATPQKLPEPGPDPIPDPATDPVDPPNLIKGKIIGASSELSGAKASAAVDDDLETYWQPSSGDRKDNNLWISADMGAPHTFSGMRLFLNRADILASYQLLYADDGINWVTAFEKKSGMGSVDKSNFTKVTARYVKLNFTLTKDANFQLFEWRVFEE